MRHVAVHKRDLEQLLQLARDKSAEGRQALAAAMADLFRTGSPVLSDRERFLMTGIIRQLVMEVEVAVRRALAERLSDDPQAPRELIAVLANDEIEVAYPILRRSSVLHDEELIEVIRHRSMEHQLAIALRSHVSGAVSQALVDAGNVEVIRILLENPDAEIKAATMAYLVEQSRRVDTYQNPLLHRRELTEELARRMYWWVSAALRQHIVERFDIDPNRLDSAIESAVAIEAPVARQDNRPAAVLADKLCGAEEATPQLMLETLRQGEVELFSALFARLTGLRPRLANRLLFEPGGEGIAIACKAIGLSCKEFTTIFKLTRQARTEADDERARVESFFDDLDPAAARQILKGWQRHPEYQRAIWQVETTCRPGGRA